MTHKDPQQPEQDVYEFIQAQIDSVPHLEAAILLWNCRPAALTAKDLASRLYIGVDDASKLLRDLIRLQLIAEIENSGYTYHSRSPSQDDLMLRLDRAYRRDLVRISKMIHLKAPSPVREFARAFRIKKEQDQ